MRVGAGVPVGGEAVGDLVGSGASVGVAGLREGICVGVTTGARMAVGALTLVTVAAVTVAVG